MFPSWGGEMICVLESVLHWLLSNWCSSPIHPSTCCFRMIVLALWKSQSHSFASWSSNGRFCLDSAQRSSVKGNRQTAERKGTLSFLLASYFCQNPPTRGTWASWPSGLQPHQAPLQVPTPSRQCPFLQVWVSLSRTFPVTSQLLHSPASCLCSFLGAAAASAVTALVSLFVFISLLIPSNLIALQCSIWKAHMASVVLTGHWLT